MFELIRSGGWLMWPIVVCSVLALAIIVERCWSLRRSVVAPRDLMSEIQGMTLGDRLTNEQIDSVRETSALGQILAAGLSRQTQQAFLVKDAIEEAGGHVVHELERYLNALGTIAATTPLLGLLGTVIGMIKVFSAITAVGVGDPQVLAGGISEALITTAAGLSVGIPSLMFHRYFLGKVNELTVAMEQDALRFMEVLQSGRKS
ncbi:MAG: MotA/TolQ/ExbB proton channel family protein [Pseudomonadota bacterium]|nr:MotA/TolQ/ExbB proton channel family protein [Pseudomonadota bacterium]HIA89233.1 MotA/TolQ/ExbB proton channel family protein [Gammaproteobacteria bacterium]HIM70239.1 MotA/TolQ/ExbB proton channel family protein [Gammaproteobacteria bacterium]